MKEQYIKRVKAALSVSRRSKQEIVRDLEEIFSSALEHGETEQEVIERLGMPREFARSMEEQLGIDAEARRKKQRVRMAVLFIAAAVFFGTAAVIFSYITAQAALPVGVIGGADGPTAIFVTAAPGLNLINLFLLLGGAFLLAAFFQTFRYVRRK